MYLKQIQIKDMSGKIIQSYSPDSSSKKLKGNLQLPAGVYIFEIKLSDGEVSRHKWIVR
jgi:hypothetical protein